MTVPRSRDQGLFLQAVKERRPDLVVEGVEPDGFAALAAAQHLDRVYEGAAPRGGAFPRRPARAIARVQARPRPSRTTSTTARTTRSRKRVIQRRFNVSVPHAIVPEKGSTRRERSER